MDNKRKELIKEYKETEIPAGVYQIKNTKNQKIFIGSSPNLKGAQNRLQFGFYGNNKALAKEWEEYGADAFVFEILEVLEIKKDVYFDKSQELKKLEQKWIEKLQPFGDKGYHG